MKKVAIIGAGVAGLSAGIFARQNGFETEIFERHALPGGLCTGWKRGGYVFDGCLRYVYGSREGKMSYDLMQRIGAADGQSYTHHEETVRMETSLGKTVVFYCDLDRLQRHLLELSPEDGGQIKKMVRSARAISRCALPTGSPASWQEFVEFIKVLVFFVPQVVGNAKATLGGFAAGLKSPALREAFLHYYAFAKLDDLPLFVLLMDLAEHHLKNAGWPQGGSLELMKSVERRYLELGGKVNYGCGVDTVIVKDGKAAGVRLAGGEERAADYVISAADAHATLEKMLGGRFTPPEYQAAFATEKPILPVVQVSLGVAMDLGSVPHNLVLPLNEKLSLAGMQYDHLAFKHYCYDGAMAPEGKSVVVAMLETEYGAWAKLAEDRERYRAEKESAARQVIARLDERFPGLAGKIEACDVATPLTWQRYTGNFEGSPQGWQTTKGHIGNLPGTLPGLKNFYMAGQWVQRGGGLPGGAMSAYNTVKRLCKDDGRRFK